MSATITEIINCIDDLLKPGEFSDYCPNGLQIQGAENVRKIIAGVTANQALIDRAVDESADAILVHHGFFWKGEDYRITGIKYQRVQALIKNNINLIAYHLPLDAHPQLGNNAQLAKRLGIVTSSGLEPGNPYSVGNVGHLAEPIAAEDFCRHVASVLGREPLLVKAGSKPIERIGWCTGAADSYIERAAALGVDAYLSGEISEPTVHTARELGVHYIAAGHHATERYGVQALGEHLANKYQLDYQFIDIDSPA